MKLSDFDRITRLVNRRKLIESELASLVKQEANITTVRLVSQAGVDIVFDSHRISQDGVRSVVALVRDHAACELGEIDAMLADLGVE